MKHRILLPLLALFLLLSGCVSAGTAEQSADRGEELKIVAATYPVYLFACAVTEGVDGVTVERLNTGEASCLHDYTLSVQDMKKIELAGVIALNGVELEEFMEDALAASDAFVIDCSEGVALLENLDHHHEEEEDHDGHDHGHFDPHIWMDPENAVQMVNNLVRGFSELDPEHGEEYRNNGADAVSLLNAWDSALEDLLREVRESREGFEIPGLITFHDGFQYFAHAYGLPLLESIEEEAGSEASAHEILEITELVKEKDIPVIFTEVNGSDATAKAISRETGCRVAQLSMCMDGPDGALSNYFDALMGNMTAIINGFAGEEVAR